MKALENREFLAFCKLLFFRSLKKQKIQAIYFKIQGTYFKISALCFLRSALCFFNIPNAGFYTVCFVGFTASQCKYNLTGCGLIRIVETTVL